MNSWHLLVVVSLTACGPVAGGEIKTEHFTIRYRDISDEQANAFAKKAEKAWVDVTRFLKRSYDKTITVDISNKHRAPYADGSRITIPANRIRGDLLKPRRLRGAGPSIAHEVTHVVAPGEQLPDRFLVEGLAVYVQEKVGGDRSHPNMGRDVHIETARLIKLYGKRIPLKECEAIRTDPKKGAAVSVAYLQEGSFVRFLIEQHGLTKFLTVYDGKSSYSKAYGKSFQELENDWVRFIEAKLSPSNTAPETYAFANPFRTEVHPAYRRLKSFSPAFKPGKGPKVYLDEGHNNKEFSITSSSGGRNNRFESLLRKDGYVVRRFSSSFTRENLNQCDILVVAVPQADANIKDWSYPHPSAFSRTEINELLLWIREGGSLFLISEHAPMAGAVADFAILLGAQTFDGVAVSCIDAADLDLKDDEYSQIVFGSVASDKWRAYARHRNKEFENYQSILTNTGNLARHPIVQGRNRAEQLKSVVTWGGSAFRTSQDWSPLLTLGQSAVGVVSPKDNLGDVEVSDVRFPLGGWLQAATRVLGKGRIVMQTDTSPISFNDQYILNVLHWLSGVIEG